MKSTQLCKEKKILIFKFQLTNPIESSMKISFVFLQFCCNSEQPSIFQHLTKELFSKNIFENPNNPTSWYDNIAVKTWLNPWTKQNCSIETTRHRLYLYIWTGRNIQLIWLNVIKSIKTLNTRNKTTNYITNYKQLHN